MTIKTALQRDLDRFFKAIKEADYNIRQVTKGGFSSARKKLDPWAFQRLNEVAVESFYRHADFNVWGGYRVLAADGSRLMLPNHASVREEFGQYSFGPKADSLRSMACCSMLYDAFNHLTLDAQIAPYSASESSLLIQHLEKTVPGDLLYWIAVIPVFGCCFY